MRDIFQFTIGRFSCYAINDGDIMGNAGMLFANAPGTELALALEQNGLQADQLASTWTCLLIDTGSELVLIDTGAGSAAGNNGGRLVSSLASLDIKAEDIDVIILTHSHLDHIGGCLDENNELVFPNARYFMWHREWTYWTSENNLADLPDWMANTARRILPRIASRLTTLDDTAAIRPGIRSLPLPGHTAGHIAVTVESEDDLLIVAADTALHPIHISHPSWVARVDQFPEQTIQSRLMLYEQAAQSQALVLFFHFTPFPSLGRIVKEGDSWRWAPRNS